MDSTKAFDTVNRDGLWKVMQKCGYPGRFTHMVRQLHDGMTAHVTDNGTVSEAFAVTNGLKQGCVLAPTLFSLMFLAMLMDAYRDEQPGIHIAYRTNGHLLNSRRMQTSTRVSKTTVHDLLFEDNCALNTVTEEEMQRSMGLFAAGCADFWSNNLTTETVIMHEPPPSVKYNAPRINVNGAELKNVKSFAYLGSTLSRNTRIDGEVRNPILTSHVLELPSLRAKHANRINGSDMLPITTEIELKERRPKQSAFADKNASHSSTLEANLAESGQEAVFPSKSGHLNHQTSLVPDLDERGEEKDDCSGDWHDCPLTRHETVIMVARFACTIPLVPDGTPNRNYRLRTWYDQSPVGEMTYASMRCTSRGRYGDWRAPDVSLHPPQKLVVDGNSVLIGESRARDIHLSRTGGDAAAAGKWQNFGIANWWESKANTDFLTTAI
ncbi:unnamed protein product [Schistocephalus solidus]|uniref:Reverse transcriptase domain-containing protein n=1 Tax=Schistocephalus solidus TaxID=70667 RepID=A0A183SDM6_SCHSO|nr:unnamed protein product [Schistocephalus solidus]